MDQENRRCGVALPQVTRAAEARSGPRWPWMVIGCLALMIRLLYDWQVHATDLANVLVGDARGYEAWAGRIAGGAWLGDRVFYQAPLYPYFLGVVFWLGGHHLGLVRIIQCVIGAASCVFLGRAGERFFSRPTGYAAGLLLALNPTAIFFDGLIQKAVLDLFFFTLALALAGRMVRGPGKVWTGLALGAALGCLTLSRENALVILPWLVLWSWKQGTWRQACALCLGACLVLLPVAFRNLAVGGEFHLTTAQIGPNLFIGNNEHADGTYQPLKPRRGDPMFEQTDATEMAEKELGRKLTPREVSDFWVSKSLEFIRREPWRWMRLMGRKWFLIWNAVELGDTEEQCAYGEYSPLLEFLSRILHFGVLCPLAVLGFVVTWGERRRLWILYAIALAYALSVAAFYVFARYRFPLIPVGILFAAAGTVRGFRLLRQGPRRVVCAGLAAALAAAVFSNWPVAARATEGAVTFCNLGLRLARLDEFDRAIPYFKRALRQVPNYDAAHGGLGMALAKLGQFDEALEHLQTAASLDPESVDAQFNLGVVLEHFGRFDESTRSYRNAIQLDSSRVDASNNLANLLSARGGAAEAVQLLEHAAKVDPAYAPTFLNMSSALFNVGRVDEAMKSLEKCVQLQPDIWQAHYNLGRLKALQGDAPGAVSALRQAEKFIPPDSPHLPALRSLLAEQSEKLAPRP